MADIQQLRKGSTPLLILSLLSEGPKHGYAIMHELEARSDGYFTMTAALLYPTLHQMEGEDLVEAIWENLPGQRRKKVYSITTAGRKRLTTGHSEWRLFSHRLFSILDPVEWQQRVP